MGQPDMRVFTPHPPKSGVWLIFCLGILESGVRLRKMLILGHTFLIVWFTYTGAENIGLVGRKLKIKNKNKTSKFESR
jgi:hypothetical protein